MKTIGMQVFILRVDNAHLELNHSLRITITVEFARKRIIANQHL